MNKKSILTLLILLFITTFTSAQNPIPPGPPGGSTIPGQPPTFPDLCLLGCFGGCPPIAPSCHSKQVNNIGALISKQSGIIFEDGYLNYVESSSDRTVILKIDLLSKEVSLTTIDNGVEDTKYFEHELLSKNLIKYSEGIGHLVITNSLNKFESNVKAGGCGTSIGAAAANLVAAVGSYTAAVLTGNSAAIGDAWATVETAFALLSACHLN